MNFFSNHSNYVYAKNKAQRHLFIVLIIALMLFCTSCSKTSTAWQEFAPAEGTFKVLFPGQPTVSDKIPASTDGRGFATVYGVNNGNQGSFMVNRIEFNIDIPADELDDRLDFVLEGVKAKYSEKLLGDQVVWSGEHRGLELKIDDSPRTVFIRFFLTQNEQYQIMAVVPNDSLDAASKFLDSFELI